VKIAQIETLHADVGWRTYDFVKLTADNGLVGWSEYNESFGGLGVSDVIASLAPALIGKDARAYEAHVALMQALRRTAAGGVNQQAIAAIENALLDVKARVLRLAGRNKDAIKLYKDIRAVIEKNKELSDKERMQVKSVAEELLAILKRDKIVLDWRKEQSTRAAVRVAVEETLDRLPEAFTRQLYAQKCDAVYQHVFDSYWDDGHSVYDRAA